MTPAGDLAGSVGPDVVSTDRADRDAHASDWSPEAFVRRRAGEAPPGAEMVLHPRTTADVAAILSWAQESRTAIVPFGGGSSVCRGIAPDAGAVVDTRAMDQILDVDERSRLVRVRAGVAGRTLKDHLERAGYALGHEPQSIALSTVGGWLATRACGQLSARYGGIEDLVVGLEAVLPGGAVVRSKAVPRRATGPDVASLMIGSEGAFGIITEATLRIAAVPRRRADLALGYGHMSEGVTACRAIAQSDLRPTMVRLYDRDDAALSFRHREAPPDGPVLLISFEGDDAEGRAQRAQEICRGDALDSSLTEYWWEHRNDAVDAYREVMSTDGLLGPHALVDTIEVSATWTAAHDLYDGMKGALQPHVDLIGCHLSHVYPDGACLYFTLAAACESDDDALEVHRTWWELAMSTTLAHDGSISHHHGIGRVRAPWLQEELGGWWDVLVAVKNAIDPHRIMNPGALGL